jgi:transcriptional regulator with XRE-family HTH domain
MNIGARLKAIRQAKKLSGRALALKVGVVPSQIYKIEGGATNPSLDLLDRICQALAITLSDFFAEERPELAPDLRRLLETAKKLTPEQREHLQKLFDTMVTK